MGQVNELKDFTRGQLDAALMKIGQDAGLGTREGIVEFLAGRLVVTNKVLPWTDNGDGTITFTLTSNGKSGEEWITYLDGKGLTVGDYAKSLLRSKDFKPAKAGTPYQIVVLKGELFSDSDRISSKIRAEAKKRKLLVPNPEVACLIRDMFSDEDIKEMGLDWIITFHEPIKDSDGSLDVLGTNRCSAYRLNAYYGHPGSQWDRGNGFAFAVA